MGLGNPGKEYEKTRHNAGRMAAELFAKQHDFDDFVLKKGAQALIAEGSVKKEKVIVALPEVYMNVSGKSALGLVKSKKAAEKLVVIRDDLDLPLGVIKMTFGRGSGGHKGVESIMRAIKTNDFVQIKIGISGATPKGKVKKVHGEEKVVNHVIGKFKPAEEATLKKVLKKTVSVLEIFVQEGIQPATMLANTK